MIAFLRGSLVECRPDVVVLDVGGIGFEVMVHQKTAGNLPPRGQELLLFTHLQTGDNDFRLFGFLQPGELALFKTLIGISGLGPRTALAILGHFETGEFYQAVAAQDLKAITRVPGVGKKTGERIIFEMKNKLGEFVPTVPTESTSQAEAMFEALAALGFGRSEVYAGVISLLEDGEELGLEENIKRFLKMRAAEKGFQSRRR